MINYLPITISFLMLVIGCTLSITRLKSHFSKLLGVLLSIIVFHSFALADIFDIADLKLIDNGIAPVSLLYGPFLYFLYRISVKKKIRKRMILIHSLPAIFFAGVYAVGVYGAWNFYSLNYIFLTASLVIYPLYIFYTERNKPISLVAKRRLIEQLSIIYLVAFFFIGMFTVRLSGINAGLGLNENIFMHGLLLISMALISRFLIIRGKIVVPEILEVTPQRYLKSTLEDEVMKGYEDKLYAYLKESKLYLSPELSLDLLSQETQIPKHHFSQLFNTYMGKSFYQLIAEYRIQHAIELLNGDHDQFTIESLAYECGFNSKTSFNRYFKEQTGYTPSGYREMKESRLTP